jgi:hypothetical protein
LKSLFVVAVTAAVLVAGALAPAAAAPNVYGTSGLIEVPDDGLYKVGSVAPAYHTVRNVAGDESLNFYTIGVGILPNLSVSGGIVADGGSDAVINAKYRLSPETAEKPSITVGVVDAAEKLNDNPGLYVAFGKNLTAAAEEVSGHESKPIRGYLGFGTGTMKGVFVGLDWTLTPKLSAMFEYLSKGLNDESHANAGIRYALTNELRIDLGTFRFKEFTRGISYNVLKY